MNSINVACKTYKKMEFPFLPDYSHFRTLSTTMKTFKEALSPPLKEKALFYLTFDELITKICQLRMCKDLPEIQSRIRRLLYFHFLNGKHERAMLMLDSYKEMVPNDTDEKRKSTSLAAWLLEISHLSVVMMNDIVNKNPTSFGQLCWWRVAESEGQALNDALLLQAVVGAFNREFRNEKGSYHKFARLISRRHIFSCRYYHQLMHEDSVERVSMDSYKRVATYQLQSLVIYLPLCAAFLASNSGDFELPKEIDDLLRDLVFFLKVKEDVRNHFLNGMKNVSIFSWVLLKAKENCDERTYTKLLGLYKETPINVTSINGVYEKINLRLICEKWLEQEALDLRTRVKELSGKNVPKNVILELLKP